jgi:hypothetical protein
MVIILWISVYNWKLEYTNVITFTARTNLALHQQNVLLKTEVTGIYIKIGYQKNHLDHGSRSRTISPIFLIHAH